jgi:hypothetical protein
VKIAIGVPLDFRNLFCLEFLRYPFRYQAYAVFCRAQDTVSIRIALEDQLTLIASTITW